VITGWRGVEMAARGGDDGSVTQFGGEDFPCSVLWGLLWQDRGRADWHDDVVSARSLKAFQGVQLALAANLEACQRNGDASSYSAKVDLPQSRPDPESENGDQEAQRLTDQRGQGSDRLPLDTADELAVLIGAGRWRW
jgi:hypothetical protein